MKMRFLSWPVLVAAIVVLTGLALKYPYEGTKQSQTSKVQELVYQRPASAPNGYIWPDKTGYIGGYKRLNRLGRSTIQVENYQSGNDFYVKLVHSTKKKQLTVRHAFVKRFESFKFAKVSPGKYYLLYKDLGTGESSKSDEFSVEEKRIYGGVKYNDMRITMYHVQGGNFEGQVISDAEFSETDAAQERRTPSDS